ncbi:hypothetical protein GGTG_11401 [Gaeumannomyces tritici R3-111a-1]|uniref:Uncharacterized protein n=1 Tax=Gaeumannomyces tritici (strain R3-111a-1) TaxID=644352 RepID=J3PD30_GAET3|nr:hypothetical protein GGTG_11401 [Gaeumannomyces tritici R3-111a-1]EJT70375.1 hypothetical protein GGTG_11401 [Gaeumannomyces tritici R3-111a-1]
MGEEQGWARVAGRGVSRLPVGKFLKRGDGLRVRLNWGEGWARIRGNARGVNGPSWTDGQPNLSRTPGRAPASLRGCADGARRQPPSRAHLGVVWRGHSAWSDVTAGGAVYEPHGSGNGLTEAKRKQRGHAMPYKQCHTWASSKRCTHLSLYLGHISSPQSRDPTVRMAQSHVARRLGCLDAATQAP